MSNEAYSSIAATRFWQDDDDADDPDGGWRVEHLWVHATARRCRYTVCDTDGNHEPILFRELTAWHKDRVRGTIDYEAWAYEHGRDPLGEYYVLRKRVVVEAWFVHFTKNLSWKTRGATIVSVRRAGVSRWKSMRPSEAPKHVQDYIGLTEGNRSKYVMSDEDWKGCRIGPGGMARCKIERVIEVPEATIARALRALIRSRRKRRMTWLKLNDTWEKIFAKESAK